MRAPSERARTPVGASRPPAASPPLARTPVDHVLAYQASAGNRAVSGVLARDARPAPKEEAPGAGGQHVVVPGIGEIPVLSVHLPSRRPPGGGSRERDHAEAGQLQFTSQVGEHSPLLSRAMAEGRQFDATVHMGQGLVIHLGGAVVASYSVGAGAERVESWTLDATSVRYELPPGPGNEPDY